jgi:hypothetical protein
MGVRERGSRLTIQNSTALRQAGPRAIVFPWSFPLTKFFLDSKSPWDQTPA